MRRHNFDAMAETGVFTQMTAASNFDATPGMDWTVFLELSIGRHIKFDACESKF